MNLAEIRQKYPQYNYLSDEDLSKRLHARYYPDLSLDDFSNRIEYQPTKRTPVAETPEAQMLAQAVELETPSLLEPVESIGRQIGEETEELLGPVARGEFDAPTALVQSVTGLSAGILGFADEMLTRLSNTIQQLAQTGEVDPKEVYKVAKMRESLYGKFEPTDPLARATLAFIGAIPAGIESAANVLADQFENPNIKAAIQTVGWFGGLAGYGQVFKAMKAPFKPKPKVGIPKTAKEFEAHMKKEAAIKIAREDKAALLRAVRKEKKEELPPEFAKELREVEPLKAEPIELLKGKLPKPIPETILRKAWRAIEPIEKRQVGRLPQIIRKGKIKEEPKKPPEKPKIAPRIEEKVEEVVKPIPKVEVEAVKIKMMLTSAEKQRLKELGYSDKEIKSLKPAQAEEILKPTLEKAPVGKVKPKEPWEMGYNEYFDHWLSMKEPKVKAKWEGLKDKKDLTALEVGAITRVQNQITKEHKVLVQQAIKEGKIKSHADYPELGKKPKVEVVKKARREPVLENYELKKKQGELILKTSSYLRELASTNPKMEVELRPRLEYLNRLDQKQKMGNPNLYRTIKEFYEKVGKIRRGEGVKPPPPRLMPDTRQGMYANFILQDKAGKIFEGDVGEHMRLAEHFGLKPEEISRFGRIKETGAYTWKDVTPSHIKQWEGILRTKRRAEPEVTLETLGLQYGYEWMQAVKEGRIEKVRQATERARKEFLTPVEGNPLDKGAIAYLKTEKFRDYIEAMPGIGELSPKEIFRYDPTAKKLIATIETKGGKLKPAIRQSGYHALKEFADSFEGAKDVSKLSATWTDPTRFIQELDQGRWGGMAQKHILWPMRSTTLAKLRWSDMRKGELAKLQEKYNARSGKKADAIGDVIEYISTERLRVPSEQFLQMPQVAKALKGFKPKTKIELIDGAKELRTFFNKLLKAQNIARKSRKQKLIDYRKLYRPWVMERNIWHKLLGLKQKPETIMERAEMPDFIFPDKPPNPRALAREGGLAKYAKIRNIFRLATDYIDTAGRDIFDTNVVHNNKIHSAVLRGKGLENAAEGINRLTAEVYAGVAPRITRAAKETLPRPLHRGILKIRRMLTRAVFPLNWTWNLIIQPSSALLTNVRYGVKANMAGLRYLTDPKLNNAIKSTAYSSILKRRWGGKAHYQDIQNSITKHKRLEATRIEKVEEFANYLTSTFEDALTGHAVAAAIHHGRTKFGLKGRELWEYASEGGSKTQSMYNYADLPGLLRAREVGAISPFQTFCFEVFNTVREMNIPGLRKVIGKTGLYETMSANSIQGKALMSNRLKMIARWVVGIAIINAVGEKVIGRKPWQPSSFVPFIGYLLGGYAGRGPVPHQYIQDAKKGIKDVLVNEDFGRLRKWVLRYHVLAGVQINRMIDGIEAVAKGGRVEDIRGRLLYKIEPEEYLKGVLMGPYRTEPGKEYIRKRRKAKSLIEQLRKKQGRSTTID